MIVGRRRCSSFFVGRVLSVVSYVYWVVCCLLLLVGCCVLWFVVVVCHVLFVVAGRPWLVIARCLLCVALCLLVVVCLVWSCSFLVVYCLLFVVDVVGCCLVCFVCCCLYRVRWRSLFVVVGPCMPVVVCKWLVVGWLLVALCLGCWGFVVCWVLFVGVDCRLFVDVVCWRCGSVLVVVRCLVSVVCRLLLFVGLRWCVLLFIVWCRLLFVVVWLLLFVVWGAVCCLSLVCCVFLSVLGYCLLLLCV